MLAVNILSALLVTTPIQTDCLFVLAHAGETNEMLPIMEEMQKRKRDFRVIAFGVAQDLIKDRIDSAKQLCADEWGISIDRNWPADRELFQKNVEALAKDVHAKVVVTGVAMMLQKQFLEAYQMQSITVAFWDNPEPRGAVPYFTTALKVQAAAQKVLFPSGFVASAKEFESRPEGQKIVMGKPTLLLSLNELHRIDRNAVAEKLGFSTQQPIIVFIGTYGDRYQKAFQLFAESFKKLPDPKPQVIFQIHPMAKGDFEEQCCVALLGDEHKYILSPRDPRHGISMLEAMAAADLVVTYNSSAGFQALLGGKRVLYVVPQGDEYSNSLIEQGITPKASSLSAIIEEMNKKSFCSSSDELMKTMQIPSDPKERFIGFLDQELNGE